MLDGDNQKRKINLYHIISNQNYTQKEMCQHIGSAIETNKKCLDKKYPSGNSILHLAIHHKLSRVTKFLIKKGCDINLQNHLGQTPLHLAIEILPKMAELLIKKKCNRTLMDNFNEGPMHVAAKYNVPEIVKMLIKLNYPLTLQNNRGETPLHLAASYNSAVSLLILSRQPEVKHYINLVDMHSETALHKAVRSGSVECIKILDSLSDLNKDIPNDEGYTAEKLIYTLEHDNKEDLLKAFKVTPIKNSFLPEFGKVLFRTQIVADDIETIKNLKNEFKSLKIECPQYNFESNEQESQLHEQDFLFGTTKIESYLSRGGDPNAVLPPNNYSLLYCAFIYKQDSIFLQLIRAGATLAEENLINQIELMMSNDRNTAKAHARFIFDVQQKLFASAEMEIKSYQREIQFASQKLEEVLGQHNLLCWFSELDITKINYAKLENLKNEDLKNCINCLYELCSGKIKKKVSWQDADEDPSIRSFDNVDIQLCIAGLLDQFEPNLILDALIMFFEKIHPKNIQSLICLYILKEVIILNLEFRYRFNEQFSYKLEEHLKNNYDNELSNALLDLFKITNKLNNSPIYSSYCRLSKLAYKYPSEQSISITEQIRHIVEKDPRKLSKKSIQVIEEFEKSLAMKIRALTLQFYEVCDFKEFRKTVWADKKKDREINAPTIISYQTRINALTTFVYKLIDQQKEMLHRINAFTLFTNVANNCLLISQEIGPDVNVLIAIMGGLWGQAKNCLAHVNKNTRKIYKDLTKICNPNKNHKKIRTLLESYVFSLPFLGMKLHEKDSILESRVVDNANAVLAIGKFYSQFLYIRPKLSFLLKDYSSDLLFLLSTIEPDESIIKSPFDIEGIKEIIEELNEEMLLILPNKEVEIKEEREEKSGEKSPLLTLTLLPHVSNSRSNSHSHSSKSSSPHTPYTMLDSEHKSEEKDLSDEQNTYISSEANTLTPSYTNRRKSRSLKRNDTMNIIGSGVLFKSKK